MNLNLLIADGGPLVGGSVAGPTIVSVDLVTASDLIFHSNNTGQTGGGLGGAWQASTTTSTGTVAAGGILAHVVLDFSGVNFATPGDIGPGAWTVNLDGGNQALFGGSDWDGTPNVAVAYANGEILAYPEPSSMVLAAFGLAALAAFGWRRRR